MSARRIAAALLGAMILVACASPARRQDPVLRPTGAETLPTWQRSPNGTATLVVPADLLFDEDSAALSPSAHTVLQPVVGEFRPGGHVLVEGHADSDGSESYNQALSERRAASVAAWLAAQGVPHADIEPKGWGESRPARDEVDESAKAQNRRVVVTVTPPTPTPVRPLRTRPRTADDPPTTRSYES